MERRRINEVRSKRNFNNDVSFIDLSGLLILRRRNQQWHTIKSGKVYSRKETICFFIRIVMV